MDVSMVTADCFGWAVGVGLELIKGLGIDVVGTLEAGARLLASASFFGWACDERLIDGNGSEDGLD